MHPSCPSGTREAGEETQTQTCQIPGAHLIHQKTTEVMDWVGVPSQDALEDLDSVARCFLD